ncbi:ring finger protein 212B (R212B) [Vairimorpha necatrix]|uniref:Ring finger protein 212B (R212B) n=1 Tax=Vairimorpha necatrix TaxID=6039 RepID=A0AAX4JA66_9MICR
MNEEEILKSLIFCNICYYPEYKSKSSSLLISYCMHVVCNTCLSELDYCPICNSKTTFMPITNSLSSKLTKNPTELFSRPVDICMFQVNSSINLIEYLREQIKIQKKLLKLAKMEIEKLKNQPKSNIKQIRTEEKNKNVVNNEKIKKVCDIIKTSKKKSDKSTSILDFSNSSCTTGRLTIPKDFNPYKKFYRK